MLGQILGRDGFLAGRRERLRAGASTAVLALADSASAITLLTVALALSAAPAWADGGNASGVGGGQGGVDGTLASATGQNAANGATAGGGGGGVDLTTGNGAPGGSGGTLSTFNSPNGVPGATGATGQVISTSGTISTSVSGGTGGVGAAGAAGGAIRGGGGGGGGVGVSATADIVVTNSGSVTGGDGGVGGSNSNGGGGGGGVGVFSSSNVTVEAGGSVTGGVGGRGGTQSGGGGGAAAIVLTGGGTVQNSGNLLGGTGGRTILAGGSDGGAGVLLLSGGTIINGTGATIIGGTGGLASLSGIAGDGGAGIKGANISVINAGTISGGAVGAGGGTPIAGSAIEFTGGVNSLEIQAGSTITGNVVAFSTADTFKLGGDTNASFDVSQFGAGAKYDGFGFYEKTGNSTWTLTGTTTAITPWTLSGGILQISNDNNLGAPLGGLTFNGGTLETTADIISARTIVLTGSGTFLTDPGTTLTLSNAISGAGGLTKAGGGTMVLTGINSYTGGTTITAGTLVGNAASIRGDIGNSGTVVFDQAADAGFAGDISGTGTMVKDGAGTLTLSGISVLDWTIDQGGLVSAAERFGGDVSIGAGSSFTFDQTAHASYAGVLSGAGTFVKDGQGTLVLASDSSAFTGTTSVSGGTLAAGTANAFSPSSQFSVASGATLDLAGTSQTIAGLTNVGTVRIAGGGLGNTLTISGDYVGNGGNIILNTALGGDGSTTDMLVIAGNTLGTGTLQVVNFGGAGDQTVEGIKIVDVGGISNGSFSLNGNYTFEGDAAVVAGAYAYRLYQGGVSTPGDGDWYLRSELDNSLLFQAGAPLYEAYAGTLQSFNQLGTLQQRLGNRSWTVEAQGADGISDDVKAEAGIGLWGRIEGSSGSYDPESSTTGTNYDTSTWRVQTGADMLVSDTEAGQLIGGVAFQYGTVSADVSSVFGSGSIDTTGYGVSGSLTWYGAEGFYLDGQAQVIWYDSNLDSATAGQRLVDGNNGVGYALGVEAGKRIMLDPSWSLTPQAQLAWSSVDLDAFTDAFGARVAPGNNDSLLGRLGLSLDRQSQWQDRTGRAGRTDVYGVANLYYDFRDGSSVDLAGSSLSSRNEQLWGGLGIGGTINWADDKFSVFGEAVARTGLEDFGSSHALTGSLGFRVKW